jgi:hypothetical protein
MNMQIFTLSDNSIVGPFTTLESVEGGYLADGNFLPQDLVIDGVISEVPNDYVNPANQAVIDAQLKVDCKQKASELLYETDWTTIADVANSANNPHLTNQAEFIAYRNAVRKLAVNPITNPVFPTKPNEQWSN